MSDSHRLRPKLPMGEVEHANILSQDIGNLFANEDYSDVTLVVEDKYFHAHRVILAARCQYFRALLFGGMKESAPGCNEIELQDTTAQAFEALLKYIYTGRINLLDLKEDVLLDVLGLAHQYGFVDLEGSISDYLRAILSIHNVCLIYDVASLYTLDALKETCYHFIEANAGDVMNSESFLSLSESALKEVITRDSFYASEIAIFKAVQAWTRANKDSNFSEIAKAIRLPLMTMTELLNVVRPTKLLSADDILDAIKVKQESRNVDLNFRGALVLNENIATAKYNAAVTNGDMRASLLDGDCMNYDLDRGFTRHPIEDTAKPEGIVIKLGKPSIINKIKLLLWDRDMRSYSYYIEASIDEQDWVRIVDHSQYLCRSWQTLFFPPRVCRYVRIVGVRNTVNKVFHLVSFECMFTDKTLQLEKGLVVPKESVATIQASASVIEGVSRSRNALLNGDTKNYDWDSGYTCHQLGSGSIVVQLAQPYVIDCMRMLLWDCDARTYSYYVEVSTDQNTWVKVADKTKQACRGWQYLTFQRQAITFVRIVGTRNTANEVFHCVHFECPAQSTVDTPPGDDNPPAPEAAGGDNNNPPQGLSGQPSSSQSNQHRSLHQGI
ncbi:BTB/POZ domain-containing protein 9-like [Asterias rubens]|uniref:BTB/POZ domain-containing protein 9-like n=1 Tax=Asterias rubens TaxID=7604 RepID=UPI0014555972|nr:BTB/POZ domain-containing protein 9-like [Asterias rubens]